MWFGRTGKTDVRGPTRRDFLRTLAGTVSGIQLASFSEGTLLSSSAPAAFRGNGADDQEPFDVCVVGSGPAGTILACELADHGIRTLLVEGGPLPGDRPRYKPNQYPIELTRFLGAGGTSNLWSGSCPRFQPFDFSPANPYVSADAPWPITYEDIEPYYQKAERELQVEGGPLSRYASPRSSPYPFPLGSDPGFSWMEGIFADAGLVIEQPPMSAGGGIRIAKTHLPRFESSETGTLVRGTRVLQVLVEPDGEVTGLEAQRQNGEKTMLRARRYVLACGGIETPRLLLLSRTSRFPRGVGNDHDLVGRFFMENLSVNIGTADLKTEPSPRGTVEAICWQFYEQLKARGLGGALFECFLTPNSEHKVDIEHPVDSFLRWWKGYDSRVLLAVMMEMKPSESNRITLDENRRDVFGLPEAALSLQVSEHERRTLERLRDLALTIFERLGAENVELAEEQIGWTHHHMGACRMGRDERTSVVDEQLKVHGTRNLYVAGSAPFVTSGANGPTLLLTALSLRLADHLRSETKVVSSRERFLRVQPMTGRYVAR